MPRRKFQWFHYAGAVFGCAIVVAILFPVTTGHERSRGSFCLSNLKQLAMSTVLYQTDSDGRFPLEEWVDAIDPYLRNDGLLTCPEVAREGGKYGYAMNTFVLGKRSNSLDARRTLLLFETDALARNVVTNLAGRNRDRHDQKSSIVAYCDTHAKRIYKDKEP